MDIIKDIKDAIKIKNEIIQNQSVLDQLNQIIKKLNDCLQQGKKILIAGNGGSAADAQHFAAEIVGRYQQERKGYPAIALTTNTSVLTSLANDYGYDQVFSKQLEALANQGDIFFAISTSGNSGNLIQAIKKAKEIGIQTIALLGKTGGQLKTLADLSLIIPASETPRIQEIHILLIHIICQEIEKNFE